MYVLCDKIWIYEKILINIGTFGKKLAKKFFKNLIVNLSQKISKSWKENSTQRKAFNVFIY